MSRIIAFPCGIVYSTMKVAVSQMQRHLEVDLGRFDIQVRLNWISIEYKIMFQKDSHKAIMKSLRYFIKIGTIGYMRLIQ
jgi:hypothetical protein